MTARKDVPSEVNDGYEAKPLLVWLLALTGQIGDVSTCRGVPICASLSVCAPSPPRCPALVWNPSFPKEDQCPASSVPVTALGCGCECEPVGFIADPSPRCRCVAFSRGPGGSCLLLAQAGTRSGTPRPMVSCHPGLAAREAAGSPRSARPRQGHGPWGQSSCERLRAV